MDEENKQALAIARKKQYAFYKRIEAANLLAQADIDQLEDLSQWMEGVPQWLNETEKEVWALPDNIDQKIPMLGLIKVARKTWLTNEPMLTRRFIKEIEENWNNAMHDKGLVARLNSKNGLIKAGVTRKKQLEAQANITKESVLKLYKECINPNRNTAALISRKTGITAVHVRKIIKNYKKANLT